MNKKFFLERLGFVRSSAKPGRLEKSLNAFHKMQGSPKRRSSINFINSYFRASAILSFFDNSNLEDAKLFAWMSFIAKRASVQISGVANGGFGIVDLFYCLLSDNLSAQCWASQYLVSDFYELHKKNVSCNNPESYFFHWLQVKLAMQGDWDNLVKRAKFFLENPPKKGVLYHIDANFYKALAGGDIDKMEACLKELISPNVHKHRGFGNVFNFEVGLLAPWAFILAKIAWIHGYQVKVDNEYVPNQLLPVSPLSEYPIILDEFKEIDLYQPLVSCNIDSIKNLHLWSPRSPSEKPLSYIEACDLMGVSPIQ